MSLRMRPYSRERDAAPVSADLADIRIRNRADKKIMLVNLRYQWETHRCLHDQP